MRSQRRTAIRKESSEKHIVRYDPNTEVICEEIRERKFKEFKKETEAKEGITFIEAVAAKCPQLASKLISLAEMIQQ